MVVLILPSSTLQLFRQYNLVWLKFDPKIALYQMKNALLALETALMSGFLVL